MPVPSVRVVLVVLGLTLAAGSPALRAIHGQAAPERVSVYVFAAPSAPRGAQDSARDVRDHLAQASTLKLAASAAEAEVSLEVVARRQAMIGPKKIEYRLTIGGEVVETGEVSQLGGLWIHLAWSIVPALEEWIADRYDRIKRGQRAATAGTAAGAGSPLRIEVEQDGRTVPIIDHTATIDRKPFDLILYLADGSGASVRAASQAALYDLAKSGGAIGRLFNPAQTVAYEPFNRNEDMRLDDPTVQDHWWYDSAQRDHTFNEVTPAADGVRCRRRISRFQTRLGTVDVGATDFEAIYLVLLVGRSADDRATTVEERRAYLKVAFREAPPRSRPAAERAAPARP